MKHTILYLFIFCLSISYDSSSIPPTRYSISLFNNSNDSIEATLPIGDGLFYPDTTLISLNSLRTKTVNVGFEVSITEGTKPWEDRFEFVPNDTVSMYVFDPQILNNFSFDEIRSDYKVLKRYDLSLQDLQNLNFKINYPPTEEM